MKCLLVLVAGGLLVLSGCGSWQSSQPFPGVTPGPCDSACEAEVEAFRDDMASMPDIELADQCTASMDSGAHRAGPAACALPMTSEGALPCRSKIQPAAGRGPCACS